MLGTIVGVGLAVGICKQSDGLPHQRGEALAAIVCGVGGMMAVQLSTAGKGYAWLSPALLGLMAATAAFLVLLSFNRTQAS